MRLWIKDKVNVEGLKIVESKTRGTGIINLVEFSVKDVEIVEDLRTRQISLVPISDKRDSSRLRVKNFSSWLDYELDGDSVSTLEDKVFTGMGFLNVERG